MLCDESSLDSSSSGIVFWIDAYLSLFGFVGAYKHNTLHVILDYLVKIFIVKRILNDFTGI